MAGSSAIEWTGGTWNVVTGCTKVSPGCAHCYIERTVPFRTQGRRFKRVGNEETTGVRLHPERLDPKHALYPTRLADPIFVCSLSDLFHEEVPTAFIEGVFEVMRRTPERTFQVLTKRPERALEVISDWYPCDGCAEFPNPLPNVWVGVSIENTRYTWRADVLREIPAAVRFISAEPLLGSLFPLLDCDCRANDWVEGDNGAIRCVQCGGYTGEPGTSIRVAPVEQRPPANPQRKPLDLTGIDWVIVGGESGPGARPMDLAWAREIVAACRAVGVPPFVKQLGKVWARQHTKRGLDCGPSDPKGGDWKHWPPDLRVREFPVVEAVAA